MSSLEKITCGVSTTSQLINTVNGLVDGALEGINATDGKGFSYVINPSINYIDPSRSTNVITAAGRDDFPNKIGVAEKPLGTDRPNTADWLPDTAYTTAPSSVATVAGILAGYDHICNQIAGTIGGGGHNYMQYHPEGHSFIGGGSYNWISGGRATICGGTGHSILDSIYGFIGGGQECQVKGTGTHNIVVGGNVNVIDDTDQGFNLISGGRENSITGTAKNSTIIGGRGNLIHNDFNAIVSGEDTKSVGHATVSHSSGQISEIGDSQIVDGHLSARTTDASQVSMSAQSNFITFPSGKKTAATGKVFVTGMDESTGESCAYELDFMANWNGTVELISDSTGSGTTRPLKLITNNLGVVTAPALALSSGLLRPRVTGVAGKNIKWSCRLSFTMTLA